MLPQTTEVTGKFLGNKIADAVAKSNDDKIVKVKHVIDENPRNVQEIIIPLEKNRRNIEGTRTSIIKMEHDKISNY